jgi:hypothetical protein
MKEANDVLLIVLSVEMEGCFLANSLPNDLDYLVNRNFFLYVNIDGAFKIDSAVQSVLASIVCYVALSDTV